MEKLLKKQIYLFIASFILIAIIVVGSSYALFEFTSSNPNDQAMSVGNLNITYTGGSAIDNSNIEPMTDEDALAQSNNTYSFTVTNAGTVAYTYTVSLVDNAAYLPGGANYSSSMTLLNHNYIRYNLNSGSNLTLGEQTNGLIYSGTINPTEAKSFTLRLWVGDAQTYNLPNESLGAEIHLSIVIDGKASAMQTTTTTS